jgi:hypothetical protein
VAIADDAQRHPEEEAPEALVELAERVGVAGRDTLDELDIVSVGGHRTMIAGPAGSFIGTDTHGAGEPITTAGTDPDRREIRTNRVIES